MAKHPLADQFSSYLSTQEAELRRLYDDPARAFMREQERLRTLLEDPAREYMRQQEQLRRMVEEAARPAQELAEQIRLARERAAEIAPMMRAQYESASALATIALEQHQQIQESMRSAAAAFNQDDWVNRLQGRFDVEAIAELHRNVRLLGSTYEALATDLVPGGALSRFPAVASLTHLEVFTTADVLVELSLEEETVDEPGAEATASARIDVQQHIDAELVPALERLHPGLVKMLHGARQARLSKNPDRVRQFVASNRELFTHVLHALAPDERVLPWVPAPKSPKDPPLIHKEKPTRRARLLYICREINQQSFTKFVDRDIRAMVELFELLQEGTHEIDASFTEMQELALMRRVEQAVLYLLTISEIEPRN